MRLWLRLVRLRLFLFLLLSLWLGLLLTAAQQLLHQCLVALRRLQVGLQLQRLFIGFDGSFQGLVACQGVAAIVVVGSRTAFGEAFGGTGVVTGLIQRHRLPAPVGKALGGLRRLFRLQQALALLVAAQPEVFEFECAGRLWLQQQQWQTEQPAATASQRGQQEHADEHDHQAALQQLLLFVEQFALVEFDENVANDFGRRGLDTVAFEKLVGFAGRAFDRRGESDPLVRFGNLAGVFQGFAQLLGGQ